MTTLYRIGLESNDSFMLGEERITTTEPELRKYHRWRIAQHGTVHPDVCMACGRIMRRALPRKFKLRKKKLDLSLTQDGFLISSKKARDFIESHGFMGFSFMALPSNKGYFWADCTHVEMLRVDPEASHIRFKNLCENCGCYAVVMLGILEDPAPRQAPLRFMDNRVPGNGIFRTDIEFGSNHGQHPLMIAAGETVHLFESANFKGVRVRAII